MSVSQEHVRSSDGLDIVVHRWLPEGAPRAVLQLLHGSVEHAQRYAHFAEFLVGNGIAVYASDHRGHGRTKDLNGSKFYFSDSDAGWELMVEDEGLVADLIAREQPGVPVFIFGHSMGAFMARTYITNAKHPLAGAIITGTGDTSGLVKFAVLVLKGLKRLGKKAQPTPFFHNMLYGTLNREIKNPRTKADWITRDQAMVDKYLADPDCTGPFTFDYALQMLSGIDACAQPAMYAATPPELPLLVISGEEDPVGGKKCDQVKRVAENYSKAGVREVTLELVPGARHELVNETNRDENMQLMLDWMLARLPVE